MAERALVEDVFKFVSVRPPEPPSLAARRFRFVIYEGEGPTALTEALRALDGTDRADEKARDLARTYLESDRYVADPRHRDDANETLGRVGEAARATLARGRDDRAVFRAAAEALGTPVGEFLASEAARAVEKKLWDAVYAHAVAPEARPESRGGVFARLQALHLLRVHAEGAVDGRAPQARELLAATPVVPPGLFPTPRPIERPADPPPADGGPSELDRSLARLRTLRQAATELRQAGRKRLAELAEQPPAVEPTLARLPRRDGGFSLFGRRGGAGRAEPVAAARRLAPWRLQGAAAEALRPATLAALGERGLAIEERSAGEIADSLEQEMRQIVAALPGSPRKAHARRVGSIYLASGIGGSGQPFGRGPLAPVGPIGPPAFPPKLPPRKLRVRSMVGDLLVVKQELLRYEPGEVAHIENVLKSEHRERKHRRLRRTDELVSVVTERSEESERDLQSTERFEVQRESQRTIESDVSLEAGLTVSASYGFVETTAYGDFAYQGSRSESERNSTEQAREITERAVSRIMERVREERTRRTIEEFEEHNTHGFDNAAGPGHVTGIYRWVDKIYRAQVVNYGRRLMLELLVPEPAAFYIHAETHRFDERTLEKPLPPTVWFEVSTGAGTDWVEVPLETPNQLDPVNYLYPVGRHNVSGVTPPPAAEVVVGAAIDLPPTGQAQSTLYAKVLKELEVPAGYRAVEGWVRAVKNMYEGEGAYDLETIVGVHLHLGGGGGPNPFPLNGEEKVIPLSVEDYGASAVVNVEVRCERSAEHLATWQLATFQSIRTAYEQQKADYEERLAASAIRDGVLISGRNPLRNRDIERQELKKAAITMMSGEDFRGFDGLRPGQPPAPGQPQVYPEIDVAEANRDARRIRFFEQAFEWDQLTYLFYPYFWGRKDNWRAAHQIEDVDPLFTRFLQAGAARVLVPVRPSHEALVIDYLSVEPPRDDPWNGGATPVLGDPLFVSLVDELREQTGGRGGGTPVGEPWEVTVPTSLVILQADGSLPDFTAPADGGDGGGGDGIG